MIYYFIEEKELSFYSFFGIEIFQYYLFSLTG